MSFFIIRKITRWRFIQERISGWGSMGINIDDSFKLKFCTLRPETLIALLLYSLEKSVRSTPTPTLVKGLCFHPFDKSEKYACFNGLDSFESSFGSDSLSGGKTCSCFSLRCTPTLSVCSGSLENIVTSSFSSDCSGSRAAVI